MKLNEMSSEEILIADRVLNAGLDKRNMLSSAVAVGCGAFTAMSLISNPVGWGAGAVAIGVSMLRGGLITSAVTTLWHHGEIRSKAGTIRFCKAVFSKRASA